MGVCETRTRCVASDDRKSLKNLMLKRFPYFWGTIYLFDDCKMKYFMQKSCPESAFRTAFCC